MNTHKELYISFDIEADGPIPGPYSMTAFGASVAGYKEGNTYKALPTEPKNVFYAELKPISDNYILQAMKVGIYTNFTREQINADETGEKIREYLQTNGEDPETAMTRLATWVEHQKQTHKASTVVFAAFPLGFDWMFMYWYLINFSKTGSPFGHSRHIDIKTLYSARSGGLIGHAVKRRMKKSLLSKRTHTHKADDDAVEQGELLMNILMWDGE